MRRINDSRAPLYIAAMSYRGLKDAAALADRIGQHGSAREWRLWAVELNRVWTATVNQSQPL
jgi:GH15 family glucan-1,4-alpha-glucosidase